jgi:hypothetical protein
MPVIKENDRRWFDIPDDPEGGAVEVMHLGKNEIADIVSGCQITRTFFRNGEQETVTESTKRYDIALISASVKNWRGFRAADGAEMKCTKENIAKWCQQDWFPEFIDDCRMKLKEAFDATEKDAEKN